VALAHHPSPPVADDLVLLARAARRADPAIRTPHRGENSGAGQRIWQSMPEAPPGRNGDDKDFMEMNEACPVGSG